MSEELKPCPFCGEVSMVSLYAPKYPISADCDDAQVRCSNCDAVGPPMLCDMDDEDAEHHWPRARQEAITAWNTRNPSEVTP